MITTSIITYNRLKLTKYMIDSYSATVPKNEELLVVDNNSIDGTREWLIQKRDDGIINNLILNDRNYGLGYAANQGMRLANKGSEYVSKFDNDFFFENGWYENFLSIKNTMNPEVILVSTLYPGQTYEKTDIICNNNARFLERKGKELGACFYIKRAFQTSNNLWMEERPFTKNYIGPNYKFFLNIRSKNGKILRIIEPWVSRKYEMYSDPEHEEYYKEVFGARGILNKLQDRIAAESRGEPT